MPTVFRTPGGANKLLISMMRAVLFLLVSSVCFAQVQTEMKLFSDSFVSPTFEATQKTSYQFVGAQLKTDSFSEDILRMDISGGVAVGEPLLNYLNIAEIYFQKSQDKDEFFYFGRKRMPWSELDARWDFGVWEPVFKWNPLLPERQGLTGLFWQINKPQYTFGLFASPLYLPDQGPSFEIENGSFVKGNPWFHHPPETIRIWNQNTSIDYKLMKPNEAQIVLQNSFGMSISFGSPQNLRSQISYIYKPSNQLAMGYEGNMDVATLRGIVNLQPQVSYHSLTSLDVSYKTQNKYRLGLSGLFDHPNKDEIFDSGWTHPVFSDALLFSPFIEWTHDYFGFSIQHLKVFGGEVTEKGDLANPQRIPLMVRYPFQEANQIAVMSNYAFGKKRRLNGKLSYTQSEKNNFQLIRLNSRLRFSPLWYLMGEMQLLKAGLVSLENQNEIAQFENNDRVMLGVGYVF